MATVTLPYVFSASTTASAAQVNANLDAITDQVNGLLDSTNLANAAVTENKLADLSVATAKIQALAVTEAKLADLSVATGKIQALAITDAKVAAGIDAAKIGAGTVSNTEFGYLDGVTSALQTQLNAKQATLTGGASSIASADLTASRALVSDGSGKVAVSAVTDTELGYLDGVTSSIQTQINAIKAGGLDAASIISSKLAPATFDTDSNVNVPTSSSYVLPAGAHYIMANSAATLSLQVYMNFSWRTVTSLSTTVPVLVYSDGTNSRVFNSSGNTEVVIKTIRIAGT